MLKTFVQFMLVMIICPFALSGQTKEIANPPSWFWGCWVVSKPLPTPGISGISPDQVKAIIGARIVYQPKHARSGHRVAPSPEYTVTVLSGQDFLSLGYVRLNQIGIDGDKVTRIQLINPQLSDLEFPGNDVFLRKADIVIEVENTYFAARRAKVQDVGCKSEETEGK
jgi:hypothetical protein